MKATSSRRKLIVVVLLGLAVVGSAIRHWANNPSVTRDVGTLLLVLLLPAIGNVVAFLVRQLRRSPHPVAAFPPNSPFSGHLLAELTPFAASTYVPLHPQEQMCVLVAGTEAFTARLAVPVAQAFVTGQTRAVELEFLRPSLALPRFPVKARFRVLAGGSLVGEGRVTRVLPNGSQDRVAG